MPEKLPEQTLIRRRPFPIAFLRPLSWFLFSVFRGFEGGKRQYDKWAAISKQLGSGNKGQAEEGGRGCPLGPRRGSPGGRP